MPVSRSVAVAPSNIALIKYMGKVESGAGANLPANSSLSMTLDSLCTVMEVSRTPGAAGGRFVAELPRDAATAGGAGTWKPCVPDLGAKGIERMGRHLERVRSEAPALLARFDLAPAADLAGSGFEFRSANTFPASSGIASSASSFAAATLAGLQACASDGAAFARAYAGELELRRAIARLSRQGSGSSCRSFEGPWVLWEHDSAAEVRTAMPELSDLVLVIGKSAKSVSSSQAHALVRTSPLWEGRVDRVASRLRSLEAALGEGDLSEVSRIAWAETWEMHSLFHTCADPFTYWEPGSIRALQWLRPWIAQGPASPIVTMDAGANLHVLVPSESRAEWLARLKAAFPSTELLWDSQGRGARLL